MQCRSQIDFAYSWIKNKVEWHEYTSWVEDSNVYPIFFVFSHFCFVLSLLFSTFFFSSFGFCNFSCMCGVLCEILVCGKLIFFCLRDEKWSDGGVVWFLQHLHFDCCWFWFYTNTIAYPSSFPRLVRQFSSIVFVCFSFFFFRMMV